MENNTSHKNPISVALNIVAWIVIVLGIVIGIVVANVPKYPGDSTMADFTVFTWQLALPWWIGGIVTGISFLGFAEIIKLLEKINLRLNQN